MIAILDYDAGNTKSVEKAVSFLGYDCELTNDIGKILKADGVIMPGQGAFGSAMANLLKYNLVDAIHEVVDKGTPFFGICVGLQLLFSSSEESPGVEGIGILPGKIIRFPENELKIPQIGWNCLSFPKESRLFSGIEDGSFVYFVHSYYLSCEDEAIVAAKATYGLTFDAAIEKDNVFACQFHPEKSSDVGLGILNNFLKICK